MKILSRLLMALSMVGMQGVSADAGSEIVLDFLGPEVEEHEHTEELGCHHGDPELRRHYMRYLAGEEGINDYPYAVRLQHFFECDGYVPDGVFDVLLAAGADVNVVDEETGLTPLAYALGDGLDDVALLLLEWGANVHGKVEDKTMLHIAAWSTNTEMICRHLLQAGVDVNARTDEGYTALDLALEREASQEEVITLLREAGGVSTVQPKAEKEEGSDYDFASVSWQIIYAARHGDAATSRRLLPEVAKEKLPLDFAIQGGSEEVVQLLLDAGAEVQKGLEGVIRGDITLEDGALDIFRKLLSRCTQEEKNKLLHLTAESYGKTPLLLCRVLLEEGAELKSRDEKGRTPAQVAVEGHYEDMLPLLKPEPADFAEDFFNRLAKEVPLPAEDSPRYAAAHAARQKLLNTLEAHLAGEQAASPLMPLLARVLLAAEFKEDEEWSAWRDLPFLLVAMGADVSAQDADGRTALHLAVEQRNLLACSELLHIGADARVKDAEGHTPLYVAAALHLPEFINRIVEFAHVSPDAEMLHAALTAPGEEVKKLTTCRTLIRNGADVNSRNARGETALQVAEAAGYPLVCRMLRFYGATETPHP